MKLTTATTTLLSLSLAAVAFAAPAEPARPDTTTVDLPPISEADALPVQDFHRGDEPWLKRDMYPQRVRYCQHASGGGGCRNQDILGWKKCYNMPAGFNDRVSSIYTNPLMTCWLFADKNCRGKAVRFSHPGIGNLKEVGLNDKGSAFSCIPTGSGWPIN